MSIKQSQLILVGFGSYNLEDMLKWRDTDKEEDLVFAPDKWPPRFKPETSCSQREIEIFLEYVTWATSLLEKVQVDVKL